MNYHRVNVNARHVLIKTKNLKSENRFLIINKAINIQLLLDEKKLCREKVKFLNQIESIERIEQMATVRALNLIEI